MKRYFLLACLAFLFIAGCAHTVIYRNNDTRTEYKITAKRGGGKTTISVNDQVVIVAWPGNGQNDFWAKGNYNGHEVKLHESWNSSELVGHWDAYVYFDEDLAGQFEL